MEFRVLGGLEALGPDGAHEVHGRKEVAVLAYLLVNLARAVPAEELVTAVWGEDAPPSAQKSLHVRLSRLRADLGGDADLIRREGGGYRLAAEPEDVDAHRFERLVADGAFDQALAEWGGPPYPDVAGLDFVQAEIRRLEELRQRALEGRLRALVDRGRHADALPELDQLVTANPLNEGLTSLAMLALYRAGRQVEALEAYRALSRALTDLGLEPSEEVRDLERRILMQDPELSPAAEPGVRGGTNLGARLTSFVGRDAELHAVRERLATARLVTLTGPGGVGKTSLALEAARGMVGEFAGGVWLVELAALTDPAQVAGAVAGVLGVSGAGLDADAGGALDHVREHLRDREALLVLDNCEHLAGGVATLVESLLAAAPGVKVLATTRQPLAAAGEAIFDVEPFPAPDVHRLEESAAVALFAERARAVRPDFALDASTRGPVAAICTRLDGLPLALELAAARVRALPVHEIAARLDDRFSLLGGRGRTLESVVEWSHDLLSEDERILFRRLSLFRAAFTLGAAEAVAAGEPLDQVAIPELLAALVDRSMVSVDGHGFRMLETLRAFGRERLAEAGEEEEVAARHVRFFAHAARAAANRLWAAGVDATAELLEHQRQDLVAAYEVAFAAGAARAALPLATALALLDYRLGEGERGRERLAAALAQPGGDDRDRLSAARQRGAMLLIDGRLDDGAAELTRARELARELDDERELDRVEAYTGLERLLARDLPGAQGMYAGLEERLVERGEVWIAAFVAAWGSFAALTQGRLEDARELARRALDRFERCGDLWGRLTTADHLGRVTTTMGEYAEATTAFERALAAGEGRVGDRIVPVLHDAGVAEVRRGRAGRAIELWSRCAEVADHDLARTGGWVMLTPRGLRWYPLMAAGHLAALQGKPADAERRYREAREVLAEVERDSPDVLGLPAAGAVTALLRARLAEVGEDAERARALATEAVGWAVRSGDRRLVARGLDALAAAHSLEPGGAEEAASLLGTAEAIRAVSGGPLPGVEAADLERVSARVREHLGDEDRLAAALERGRAGDARAAVAAVVAGS